MRRRGRMDVDPPSSPVLPAGRRGLDSVRSEEEKERSQVEEEEEIKEVTPTTPPPLNPSVFLPLVDSGRDWTWMKSLLSALVELLLLLPPLLLLLLLLLIIIIIGL